MAYFAIYLQTVSLIFPTPTHFCPIIAIYFIFKSFIYGGVQITILLCLLLIFRTARVNEIKKDVLAMVGEKRFVWARNATVAFARGIQQRLARPGSYALADG